MSKSTAAAARFDSRRVQSAPSLCLRQYAGCLQREHCPGRVLGLLRVVSCGMVHHWLEHDRWRLVGRAAIRGSNVKRTGSGAMTMLRCWRSAPTRERGGEGGGEEGRDMLREQIQEMLM